jgi:hypothetical protein
MSSKAKDILQWILKGEVSENIFLQVGIGGIVLGFMLALYPFPVLPLLSKIGFSDVIQGVWMERIVWFCSYVVPVIVGLYALRMLLNGLVQSIYGDDN